MTRLLVYLFSRYRNYRAYSLGLLLTMLVALAFTASYSLACKYFVDHLPQTGHYDKLAWLLAALFAGFAIHSAGQWLQEYWLSKLAVMMQNDMRLAMFGHVQRLPIAYYSQMSRATFFARFTNDLTAMQSAFVVMYSAVYAVLSIAVTLILTASMHWSLSLLSLAGIALSLLVPAFVNRKAIALQDELKTKQSQVSDYVQEHLTVYRTVRAFNLGRWELKRMQEATDGLFSLNVRAWFLSKSIPLTVSSVLLLFNLLSLGAGALLIIKHDISLGMLVAFQSFFLTASQQLKELTRHLPVLVAAVPSHSRIESLMAESPGADELEAELDASQLTAVSREIALQGVHFGYSPNEPVIDGLDLNVPAGSYAAVIGMNGSGKSTIVNLLMRFYEPTEGRVKLDGNDARRFSGEAVRERIGYVSQETEMLNLSILDNIRLGRPEATEAEVMQAARKAGIHAWIERLPAAYLTPCGDYGSALSGGQKQRIAIARLLLRDPDVMLLDEATSSLDPESEAFINGALRKLAGAKTIINVTHRLSSVTDADAIFLMDRGKVVHAGTHAEMLKDCELYRMLWNKQSGFLVSGDGRTARIDAERLKTISLFAGLSNAFLEYMSQCLATEYVPAGETVVERGGEGDKFYIIVRGRSEVLKRLPGQEEENRVAVLEDGDHFGEIALMMSLPRTATIRTLTPCTFLTLHRTLFQTMLDSADPELRWRLEQSCRERLTY